MEERAQFKFSEMQNETIGKKSGSRKKSTNFEKRPDKYEKLKTSVADLTMKQSTPKTSPSNHATESAITASQDKNGILDKSTSISSTDSSAKSSVSGDESPISFYRSVHHRSVSKSTALSEKVKTVCSSLHSFTCVNKFSFCLFCLEKQGNRSRR